VQARYHRRPGIYIAWQQVRTVRQRTYERALSSLDLADNRDPARLRLERSRGFLDDGRFHRLEQLSQIQCATNEIASKLFEWCAKRSEWLQIRQCHS
jgi:hypothetical protein